ncbi:MAG: hypothetical protein ACOCXT_06430 [Candidatus Dojkabacteria bacterium]
MEYIADTSFFFTVFEVFLQKKGFAEYAIKESDKVKLGELLEKEKVVYVMPSVLCELELILRKKFVFKVISALRDRKIISTLEEGNEFVKEIKFLVKEFLGIVISKYEVKGTQVKVILEDALGLYNRYYLRSSFQDCVVVAEAKNRNLCLISFDNRQKKIASNEECAVL